MLQLGQGTQMGVKDPGNTEVNSEVRHILGIDLACLSSPLVNSIEGWQNKIISHPALKGRWKKNTPYVCQMQPCILI